MIDTSQWRLHVFLLTTAVTDLHEKHQEFGFNFFCCFFRLMQRMETSSLEGRQPDRMLQCQARPDTYRKTLSKISGRMGKHSLFNGMFL